VILEPAKSRIERDECPSCGKPKSEWDRRKDWRCCSTKCTAEFEKYFIYYGWTQLREKALKRDEYRCVKCGSRPTKIRYHSVGFDDIVLNEEYKDEYKQFTIINKSNLIGDHIKPIALGGDEWDINNIQTLCIDCNKIKTAQDQKDIAKLRAIEKRLSNGQQQLVGDQNKCVAR